MSHDTPHSPRPPRPGDPTSAVDPSPVQHGGRLGGAGRADVPLPEHVGSYRILRELGHGGMGVVYLATRDDVALNRLVALKLVHRGMASPGVLDRFERERQVLGALNHPNIARLLDGGTSGRGEPYFVMEYVEGRPIDEYCDARRLTIAERLALFRQVCAAVHHAHQNLIVHRDIKPRNILVTAEGVPKLLDFGIAKLLNPSMAPSLEAPTQTGLRLMTPEYASPEQVKGLPITTATDVYSLGVVLFELLTGHRPYRLRTRVYHEVERIICEEEPQKPSTAITRVEEVEHGGADPIDGAAPDTRHPAGGSQLITPEAVGRARRERPPRLRRALEGDIDNIVLMALRKEPQRRYASVEQFADDIRRHLEGHTVIARADTLGYRAAKFVRRHRAAALAAGVVVVALLAGLTTTLWQWRKADALAIALQRTNAELQATLDARNALADATIVRTGAILSEGLARVARLPDSVDAQRWLAEQVRGWLGQISGLVGADAAARLTETMAEAMHRIGSTQAGRRGQNEGDIEAALASHREGHDLRAALVQESPGDPVRRLNLAASKLRIADVLRLRDPAGARAAAAAEIDAAFAIADSAARELGAEGIGVGGPAATRAVEEFSKILGAKADRELEAGRVDEARATAERALALLETAFAHRLLDAPVRSAVATAHHRLAVIEKAAGRLGDAVRHARTCVAAREQLADDPGGVSHRRRLVTARRTLGEILLQLGDVERDRGDAASSAAEYAKARDAAGAALALAEELAAAPQQPENADGAATSGAGDARPALDRILCLQQVGRAELRLGRRDVAVPLFRRAVDESEGEIADFERAGKRPSGLLVLASASVHLDLVEAAELAVAGAAAEAVAPARRAVERYSALVAPGVDPMDNLDVLRSTARLGQVLSAAGQRGEGDALIASAIEGYRRADRDERLGDFERALLSQLEDATKR